MTVLSALILVLVIISEISVKWSLLVPRKLVKIPVFYQAKLTVVAIYKRNVQE